MAAKTLTIDGKQIGAADELQLIGLSHICDSHANRKYT
jgi:hypothetical protein